MKNHHLILMSFVPNVKIDEVIDYSDSDLIP